jgi:hypothetical protein
MVKLSEVSKCLAKGKGQCRYTNDRMHKMRSDKKYLDYTEKFSTMHGGPNLRNGKYRSQKGPIQHLHEKKNNFVTLFIYYGFANTLFAVLYYIFSFVIEK